MSATLKVHTKTPIKSSGSKWLTALSLLLTLLPPVLLFIELLNYVSQVPLVDEYLFVPLVIKLHTGGFTLADFWNPNNEHRVVVWRILALALAKLGGYSVLKEVYTSLITAVLTLLVGWRLLGRSVSRSWKYPLLAVTSCLLFSAVQEENWKWGFQLAWFMVNLLVLAAILFLSFRPVKPLNFAIAVGLAIAASYTSGTGLMIWPTVLVVMLLEPARWGWKYIAGWSLTGLGTVGLYFFNYTYVPIGAVSNKTYFVTHPGETLVFILNYLGCPLGYWGTTQGALWFGLAGLGLAGLLAGWLWRRSTRTSQGKAIWQAALPWLEIALFGLFSAVFTAVSRVEFGVEGALTSRYTTVAVWFWISLTVLGVLAGGEFYRDRNTRVNWAIKGGATGLTLLLIISYGLSYAAGYRDWLNFYRTIDSVRPFMYDYSNAPAEVFKIVYPDPERVRTLAWLLDQYHEGPFATSKTQYYNEQNNRWQSSLQAGGYQSFNYPGKLVEISQGQGNQLQAEADGILFNHSGQPSTNIEIDLKKISNLPASKKPVMVEVQLKEAQYVRIYYFTGPTARLTDHIYLAAQETNGQKTFRVTLPPDLSNFRVDAFYPSPEPLKDTLKVTLYRAS